MNRIISPRWAWLELCNFAGGIALYILYLHNLAFGIQVLFALGAAALCVVSNRFHGEGLREIGFRFDNIKEASLMLFPLLLISGIALFCVVLTSKTIVMNSNLLLAFLLYPFWALVQQYLFQGFFANRARMCMRNREVVGIMVGITFGVLHWPNALLAVSAALGGVMWTRVFLRHPNLPIVALCHGWLAAAFYYLVLGVDVLKEKF